MCGFVLWTPSCSHLVQPVCDQGPPPLWDGLRAKGDASSHVSHGPKARLVLIAVWQRCYLGSDVILAKQGCCLLFIYCTVCCLFVSCLLDFSLSLLSSNNLIWEYLLLLVSQWLANLGSIPDRDPVVWTLLWIKGSAKFLTWPFCNYKIWSVILHPFSESCLCLYFCTFYLHLCPRAT